MSTNKRSLKKEIRIICGSLAAGCIFASMSGTEEDRKAYDDIICEIAGLQTNALRLANVSYPRGAASYESKKEYAADRAAYYRMAFRKLKADFNAHVEAIIKKMNALLPAEQKEANKEAAGK